jgi:hypothetical protein
MEDRVAVDQIIPTLEIDLRSSPTIWWDTHKETLSSWDEVRISI